MPPVPSLGNGILPGCHGVAGNSQETQSEAPESARRTVTILANLLKPHAPHVFTTDARASQTFHSLKDPSHSSLTTF